VEPSRRVAFFLSTHDAAPLDVEALPAAWWDSSADADAQCTLTECSECGLLQPRAGRRFEAVGPNAEFCWRFAQVVRNGDHLPLKGTCEVLNMESCVGVCFLLFSSSQLDPAQTFAGGWRCWSVIATFTQFRACAM